MWNKIQSCWNPHGHTHTTASWPYWKPCQAPLKFEKLVVLFITVWLSVSHMSTWLRSYAQHRFTWQHKRMQNNSLSHPPTPPPPHTQTHRHTQTHTRSHKLIYRDYAIPHFCLGKKVITFSPCLNAFKSLSGAIPRWASEIHLNSFWESKQSYCCRLKLWLEREKKNERKKRRGQRKIGK